MLRTLCLVTVAVLTVGPALEAKAQRLISYHEPTKTLYSPPKDFASKYVITVDAFPPDVNEVEKIQIFNAILDDAVIRLICEYPLLKELVLPDTNTSDGNLALLLSHTNCEFLNVSGTDITNSSVALLARETSIKKLFISGTGIDREGRRKLKQLRPDLNLD